MPKEGEAPSEAVDDEPVGLVIVLLIFMAGMGYAFVKSFGESTLLSAVLAGVIIGCGIMICAVVRSHRASQRAR